LIGKLTYTGTYCKADNGSDDGLFEGCKGVLEINQPLPFMRLAGGNLHQLTEVRSSYGELRMRSGQRKKTLSNSLRLTAEWTSWTSCKDNGSHARILARGI
jgi:hypothetical protein